MIIPEDKKSFIVHADFIDYYLMLPTPEERDKWTTCVFLLQNNRSSEIAAFEKAMLPETKMLWAVTKKQYERELNKWQLKKEQEEAKKEYFRKKKQEERERKKGEKSNSVKDSQTVSNSVKGGQSCQTQVNKNINKNINNNINIKATDNDNANVAQEDVGQSAKINFYVDFLQEKIKEHVQVLQKQDKDFETEAFDYFNGLILKISEKKTFKIKKQDVSNVLILDKAKNFLSCSSKEAEERLIGFYNDIEELDAQKKVKSKFLFAAALLYIRSEDYANE